MDIISLEKVNKYFGSGENRVHVLKNISFSVEGGDFVAIIGQSGSGKSTLMNIIGCLDTQTSGIYRIEGKDAKELTPDQFADLRGRYIGFIFQRYNLLPTLSALENTALPAVYAGVGAQERAKRAAMLLDGLGLAEKLKNRPAELSGGQQQRVSIARALMNGGRLILADEPTGALDSKSGENVMEILTTLNDRGHTVIVVTHDHKVANFASRIIEIRDGEIISDTRTRPMRREKPDFTVPSLGDTSLRARMSARLDQLKEAFRMSIQAILSHKLRSLLTMLGIIIGIASVVSVVALGRGSQQKIISDISTLGTNTIDIFPGQGFGDRHSGRIKTLTISDANILGKQFYVDSVTPNISTSGDLVHRNTNVTAQMNGVGSQYFSVKGLEIREGRLFNDDDVAANAPYAVIDDNTYNKLFPAGGSAVGQTLLFKRKPLKIIGVLKKQERTFGPSSESLAVYVPYTTAMRKITGDRHISSVTVKVKDTVVPLLAEKNLTALLAARHGKQDFFTINTDSIKKTIESTTGTMTLLISGIALISLVVGGIGVMNIMLVSVTERTREIGVRMAVGATRRNILEQFLIEAVLICLIGGFLGIAASRVIGVVFSFFSTSFAMTYSPDSMLAAILCSSCIGIVFGFIPARNAARLNPIEALSRE